LGGVMEYDVLTYPFAPPGKPQKRICVPKEADFITALLRTARPWEYSTVIQIYNTSARGGSFVEVGANIGSDTVIASDYFRECHAFEPAPKNVFLFRKTMELNGITNVRLFPAAVSDHAGRERLHLGQPNNIGSASLAPGAADGEEVEVVTLDEAIGPEITDITFLHIDAEGHDIRVLQGARQFVARQKQRPYIKMEFQPFLFSKHGSKISDLIEFIEEFQYSVFFSASNFIVPLTPVILLNMYYLWRTKPGWIDIYLAS
jgi:FkbM family methyltransferase